MRPQTLKLYGSTPNALKRLGVAALFLAAAYFFWRGDPTARLVIIVIGLVGVLGLLIPVRVLLGHPMLEVRPEGVRSYKYWWFRLTRWDEITEVVIRPYPAGRTVLPAVQIVTTGTPIVLIESYLELSVEEVYARLIEVPQLKERSAAATSVASPEPSAAKGAGTYADLAAHHRRTSGGGAGNGPSKGQRLLGSLLLVAAIVGLRLYLRQNRGPTERQILAEVAPELCATSKGLLNQCYAFAPGACPRAVGDALRACVGETKRSAAEIFRSHELQGPVIKCTLKTIARANRARLVDSAECRGFDQALGDS